MGATHPSGPAERSPLALRAFLVTLGLCSTACGELDQPPDEVPTPREIATPTLTLGRDRLGSASPSPSASATFDGCCDALRSAVSHVGVEDESALLLAAIECDRMTAAKRLDVAKIRALLGGIAPPSACR